MARFLARLERLIERALIAREWKAHVKEWQR